MILLLGSLLLLSVFTTDATAAETVDKPQTLEYRVAWNGLAAAYATISIRSDELAVPRAYTIDAAARTNAFIDLFYRFRGKAHVSFLADQQIPLHFRFERDIRGVPYDTTITFSPNQRRAQSRYVKRGEVRKELALASDELLDPITAVFRARKAPPDVGSTRTYDVFTGEARYRVDLTVIGRDTVDVPAGTFPALRVKPRVWKVYDDDQPPDERLHAATIWVTDDGDHVLLKIRSDLFFGAVTLDLISRELLS